MRKILSLFAVLALAACGGGGGGSSTPSAPTQPISPPTSAPQSGLVTPSFTLVFPKSGSSSAKTPQYINGTATLSVAITLISNNGTPTTVTNPTVITNVNGTSGNACNPSCTVSGPPSPPGTDRYSVTTYDAAGGAGNTLSTATKDFTIVAGSANTGLSITLFGVIKTFAVSGVPSPNAGTTPADATLTVAAKDAAGGTITGTYGDNSTGAGYISDLALNGTPVTVAINETNALGATLVAGSGNTGLGIVLFGIVKSFAVSGVPSPPNAGTTPADATLTITVKNAAGGTITGTYGDNSTGAAYISGGGLNGTPVTVTIDETNNNGTTLVAGGSTPGATQNSTTSVTLHNDTDTIKLHYAGLAENVKTITVAATGATTNNSTTFQPTLQPITPASGTEIDLYVDSTTGGTGSTGGQTFTEAGFTGAPYNQSFTWTFTPTATFVTPCNQIATMTPVSGTGGGVFTATAPAAAQPPAAGSCDFVINDNLTQGGHVSTAKTVVTYTTSSVGASSKHRK